MLTVLAERMEMFTFSLAFFLFVGVVVRFFFFSFRFSHQLPAFLNDHCEHELWKASLHDIADRLILLFHIFSNNFVPDKLPKLYKIFVQKQSITCMKIYMYMWSITFSMLKYLIINRVVLRFYFFYFLWSCLTNMEVAHVTLHISYISFCHWNYISS